MKITVKTTLVKLKVSDKPTIGTDNYTKRNIESTLDFIEKAINETIKLHKEVK